MEIEQFVTDGFVRIDDAFPCTLAEAARELLWKATTACRVRRAGRPGPLAAPCRRGYVPRAFPVMLMLFSDVSEHDAPTRIRVGSHADIARQLAPAGEAGLTLRELAADGFAGTRPRFLAQPPLLPAEPDQQPRGELSPVELATARALAGILPP